LLKSKDQKTEFSEKALSETLLSQMEPSCIQNIIDQHKRKKGSNRSMGILVRRLYQGNAKTKELQTKILMWIMFYFDG
jgi:hypothetical protein